jgi:hypothetical protein
MFLSRSVTRWATQFAGDAYLQSMMGHGLRASSQLELVEKLKSRGFLTDVPHFVYKAFSDTDRACFVANKTDDIYANTPQKIGNHFMSTPQLHAQILSLLAARLGPGKTACEVGAGTGYLPAVFSRSQCSRVFAIENDPALLAACKLNLAIHENLLVSNTVPRETTMDALYVSPYFDSEIKLDSFLASLEFAQDAVVVASVIDEASMLGPIKDQQLLVLERENGQWIKVPLFRTLCEPLVC